MPIAEMNKRLTANKCMLNSEERSFYTLPLTIKNVVIQIQVMVIKQSKSSYN